jgi:hypothetical protein
MFNVVFFVKPLKSHLDSLRAFSSAFEAVKKIPKK